MSNESKHTPTGDFTLFTNGEKAGPSAFEEEAMTVWKEFMTLGREMRWRRSPFFGKLEIEERHPDHNNQWVAILSPGSRMAAIDCLVAHLEMTIRTCLADDDYESGLDVLRHAMPDA